MTELTRYIGEKKVSNVLDSGLKTPGDISIMVVEYEDGTKETTSSLMLNRIISEEPCDLSALRDKRLHPLVQEVLRVMCDWGIKLSELPYFSALINQSLDYNQREALLKLWSTWGSKMLHPDDVDLITLDRVLKSQTLNDILGNPDTKK